MIKLIITSLSLLLFATNLFATHPPAAVKNALEQKFPDASNIKWEKENAHEYEASFSWNGKAYSSNFSESGVWLETESAFLFQMLPEKAKLAFNKTYSGSKVKAVSKIETSKGLTKYEVEIKRRLKTIELFYTEDGTECKE